MSMSQPKVTRSFTSFAVTVEVTDQRQARGLADMVDACLWHYRNLLKAYGSNPDNPDQKAMLNRAHCAYTVADAIADAMREQ